MSEAVAAAPSTGRSLLFVYVGYTFRYLYLLILVPFYGRVLGAAEYGRLLTAMSLFQIVWQLFEWGFPIAGTRDAASTTDPEKLAALYGQHMKGRLITLGPAIAVGLTATMLSPVLRERPIFGLLATLTALASGSNMSWYFQGTLR
ncbi:MAG: polysaccharide biosynthesis protein, partial [Myxococcaceae bacterium]|nr:polysaccharide biosynthesis protein [Myxococcaceae bacterium]